MLGLNDLVGRGPRGWDLRHPRIERKRKAPRVWLVSGARTMSIWLTTHGTEFGAARADALRIGTGLQNGGV